MTVGELLRYLATRPADHPVILSKDAEGNSYSPLADAREGFYLADSTWSGEVNWPDDETPEGVAAVILGPVN